jgi:hypothetical protein
VPSDTEEARDCPSILSDFARFYEIDRAHVDFSPLDAGKRGASQLNGVRHTKEEQFGPSGNGASSTERRRTQMKSSTATVATVEQDKKLLAGVQKDLASQSFTVNDKPCTAQDVVKVLQGRISKGLAVQTARAALQAATKDFREERTQTAGFVSAFRTIVKGMFKSPDTLADFGLSPHKSPKKTLETKVTAVTKTAATRKARGTKGPKAKAKIKGTAPAATPTSKPAPTTP